MIAAIGTERNLSCPYMIAAIGTERNLSCPHISFTVFYEAVKHTSSFTCKKTALDAVYLKAMINIDLCQLFCLKYQVRVYSHMTWIRATYRTAHTIPYHPTEFKVIQPNHFYIWPQKKKKKKKKKYVSGSF